MKHLILILAFLTLAAFSSHASALSLHIGLGGGDYGPSIYYAPGYYAWYDGYWPGGYRSGDGPGYYSPGYYSWNNGYWRGGYRGGHYHNSYRRSSSHSHGGGGSGHGGHSGGGHHGGGGHGGQGGGHHGGGHGHH